MHTEFYWKYEGHPQNKFPIRPRAITIYCVNRLGVSDRYTMSHDAYTSGTSLVLKVASLQRLKTETRIPTLPDCEMRSVIKFLNAQSIAPIKILHQLCQVYGHTRLDVNISRAGVRLGGV